MKIESLVLGLIIIIINVSCLDLNENRRYAKIEYFTVDTIKNISDDIGEFDLYDVYFKDSVLFYIGDTDTLIEKTNLTLKKLLSDVGIRKGKFYSIKNLAMPMQKICMQNQIVFSKSANNSCIICFDHKKRFVSIQDSVFKVERSDALKSKILSIPSYPLPEGKFFYKKSTSVIIN